MSSDPFVRHDEGRNLVIEDEFRLSPTKLRRAPPRAPEEEKVSRSGGRSRSKRGSKRRSVSKRKKGESSATGRTSAGLHGSPYGSDLGTFESPGPNRQFSKMHSLMAQPKYPELVVYGLGGGSSEEGSSSHASEECDAPVLQLREALEKSKKRSIYRSSTVPEAHPAVGKRRESKGEPHTAKVRDREEFIEASPLVL